MAVNSLEDQLMDILLQQNHLYLILGIFAVLAILKYMRPTKVLFSRKYKWLVAPINLFCSFIGVFAFNLTNVATVGLKITIALIITAFTVLSYEALGKYVFKEAEKRISKLNGNGV